MSERNGKPLPSQWARAQLSAMSQINPRLDRLIDSDDVAVDFVPMRAVEPEGGGLLRPEVTTYGKVKKGYTAFRSGDVITAKITPCMENGKTCVVPELPGAACFGSTEFHVVRAEQGIDARWISNYLLQHSTRYAAQRLMAGGVGQMRVPSAFLESLSLPVAPSSEQSRILDTLDELLSDLDAGVAALERAKAKLKQYRSAVLKAAVEGALTAEWRAQHSVVEPASELLDRILAERRRRWEAAQLQKFKTADKAPPKDWKAKYSHPLAPNTANLPSLPPGWCWATLDQLSYLVTSGSRGWAEYYSAEGPIFVRSQDIRTDKLDLSEVAHVIPPRSTEGARTRLHRGDLLITITGANVAKTALVDCDLDEAYVSQHVAMTRFADDRVGRFTHTYVMTPSGGRRDLLRLAYGAGKPGLNLDNLRTLRLPLPPMVEQEAIMDAVQDQLSVIEHLETDLDTRLHGATALRQSILRHAFTGQLVSQDPTDEPANELLKRIAAEREERARLAQAVKQANTKTKTTKEPRKRAAKTRK